MQIRNNRKNVVALSHSVSVIFDENGKLLPFKKDKVTHVLRIPDRKKIPAPRVMFEPWMLPEEFDDRGIEDFHFRESVN